MHNTLTRHIQILIPSTCKYATFYGKSVFASVIKLTILR